MQKPPPPHTEKVTCSINKSKVHFILQNPTFTFSPAKLFAFFPFSSNLYFSFYFLHFNLFFICRFSPHCPPHKINRQHLTVSWRLRNILNPKELKGANLRVSLQLPLCVQSLGDYSSDVHHWRSRRIEDLVRVWGELRLRSYRISRSGEGKPFAHLSGEGLEVYGLGFEFVDLLHLLRRQLLHLPLREYRYEVTLRYLVAHACTGLPCSQCCGSALILCRWRILIWIKSKSKYGTVSMLVSYGRKPDIVFLNYKDSIRYGWSQISDGEIPQN